MESQRVKFLTLGYLRGWLTFENKTNLSLRREQYILNFLEHEACTEVLKTKAISEAVFTNALISVGAKNIDLSSPIFKEYLNFELPSTETPDNIKVNSKIGLSAEQLKEIKSFLDEANKNNNK